MDVAEKTLKTLNLNLAKDRSKFTLELSKYRDALPSVKVLGSNFESPLMLNGGKLVKSDDANEQYYLAKGKLVFHQYSYNGVYGLAEQVARQTQMKIKNDGKQIVGAFFPYKNKEIIAYSGDTSGTANISDFIDDLGLKDQPTVSYECLERFYGDRKTLFQKINDGEIQILDFTQDSHIDLTAEEKKTIRKKDGNFEVAKKPPESGYTLVHSSYGTPRWQWHRSATVLFYDLKAQMTILIGQDEGTYFGVELPVSSKTIKAAYTDLIPKEVQGKAFKRQGEWFITQAKESDVPSVKDSIAEFTAITLPRDDNDSNLHVVDCGDGRISKDGTLFAKDICVSHDQHADVDMTGWCRFYVNTALRSFSVDGVD